VKNSNRYNFNSSDLLYRVFKYRKILLGTSGIAGIAALIISLMITEKYQTSVYMFPAPATSISKSLIQHNEIESSKNSVYGEDEEIEQILQVLNSDELHNLVCMRHDLMHHYEIDTTDKYRYTKLRKSYNSNIKFNKTQYMAVEISVLDKDPNKAATIANDIVDLLDTVMNRMELKRRREAFAIVDKAYQDKLEDLNFLRDSLTHIMQKGVFDFESQTKTYTEAYASALSRGDIRAAKILKEKLDTVAVYGSTYISLRDLLNYEFEQLARLKMKRKQAKVDAEYTLPHAYVINNAYVPDKKAYPQKLYIVIITSLATFAVTFITLIILENIKQFKIIDADKQ